MPSPEFPHRLETRMPPELQLAVGRLTLLGTSVGARATAFALPELGVALDLGRLTPSLAAQPVVLLSHGHLDHLAGVLAYLNVRARFHEGEATTVFGPPEVMAPLRQALAVMPGMESVRKRMRLEDLLRDADPEFEVSLRGGRARPFPVDHSVPTLGWRLWAGTGARPALVYGADGSADPFRAAPELLDAEVAIVECSCPEKNRRIAARLAKHAHVLDWIELAPDLTCDTLILAHLPEIPADELEELVRPLARAFRGRLVLWAPGD
jgi:ribonuclease BN (tRNA processing enzyme)